MPLIMANSIDSQDHKDKYFDTSKKILSQKMTMCNMEIFIMYHVHRGDNIEKYHRFLKIRGLRRGGGGGVVKFQQRVFKKKKKEDICQGNFY